MLLNLCNVMQKCGIKLRYDKCSYFNKYVNYAIQNFVTRKQSCMFLLSCLLVTYYHKPVTTNH